MSPVADRRLDEARLPSHVGCASELGSLGVSWECQQLSPRAGLEH